VKKGFEFVLLVVGETGLGKSTLINSMFLSDIYTNEEMVKMERTVEVGTHQVMLEEGGVKLSLTVVDTPGYGDAVDNTD
jgi:septin 7